MQGVQWKAREQEQVERNDKRKQVAITVVHPQFYRHGRNHPSKSRRGNKRMPRAGLKRLNGTPQRLSLTTAKTTSANHQVHFCTFSTQAFKCEGDTFHYKNHKNNARALNVTNQLIKLQSTSTPMHEGDAFRNFTK
jgi:hypothetical protein